MIASPYQSDLGRALCGMEDTKLIGLPLRNRCDSDKVPICNLNGIWIAMLNLSRELTVIQI